MLPSLIAEHRNAFYSRAKDGRTLADIELVDDRIEFVQKILEFYELRGLLLSSKDDILEGLIKKEKRA